MIRKILKLLYIIQEVNNKDKKLGRGFSKAKRLNPYNPLSYLTIVLILSVGLLLFGIIGFWKQVDFKNPFKWS